MSDDGKYFSHVVVLNAEEVLSRGIQVVGFSEKNINRTKKLIHYHPQPTTSVSKIIFGSVMWQWRIYVNTLKKQVSLMQILKSTTQKTQEGCPRS